ncbi:MAG: S53 family peptidase [Candidatus Sulfotelmatobacter sp.]|jgi:subtilase family serine protease
MNFLRRSLWISSKPILIFALLASLASFAFSQTRGGAVAKPQNLGAEDPSKLITLTIWLNQHNKAALDELVRQMYQPGSPNYHHFLTREQYRSRFAPTAAETAQVRAYLIAHNFTVTSVEKYNHYVVAQGRVSDAQDAFNVQLSLVSMKGQIHRVTSGSASVNGPVGELIHTVEGLSDFAPRPTLVRPIDPATGKPAPAKPLSAASSPQNRCLTGTQKVIFTTSGGNPTATYTGNRYATDATNTCPGYNPTQLQTAYGLNSLYARGWDGTGQTIIIVDAWGSNTIQQDANTFSAVYGLPPLTASNFQIYYPGGPTTCGTACVDGSWDAETTLDVEWAHAVAPGADIALVLAPDNYSLDIAEFWAIENPEVVTNYANYDLGYVISNSWANFEILDVLYGGESTLATEYAMTEVAAVLGISTDFASGDWGDNVALIADDYGITVPPSVCMPASAPYATGVGGTSLFLNSNDHIQFQTGWGNNETRLTYPAPNPPYDPPLHLGFVYGAGGGSSAVWPEPAFQSSLGNKYRQVPDISYIADPYTGVNIIQTISGTTYLEVYGGTSLATPTFSALWAIANQAVGSNAPLGQAAAMLYSLPAGAITDIKPVNNGLDVHGKIVNPPSPVLVETAADLAQPLGNTTTFLSALYHGSSTRWYDLTFGTDTSLVTAPGWDNVTGLGTPNGLDFVKAVVAAAQ